LIRTTRAYVETNLLHLKRPFEKLLPFPSLVQVDENDVSKLV